MFVHKIVVLLSLCAVGVFTYVESANILVLEPLPARSHFKCFQPLLEKLIERGHNLTVMSGHSLNSQFESKYTHINTEKYFRFLSMYNTNDLFVPR